MGINGGNWGFRKQKLKAVTEKGYRFDTYTALSKVKGEEGCESDSLSRGPASVSKPGMIASALPY